MSGPERIFDIAIVSKIPVTFSRVMFAPAILATVHELADYYRQEIAQLRLIARDTAVTAELWIRSKHGTWRFFLVTPSALVEIDREGKRIESARDVSYMAGTLAEESGKPFSGTGRGDRFSPDHPSVRRKNSGPVEGPVVPQLPHPLRGQRQ
jgi:hypothetical protein